MRTTLPSGKWGRWLLALIIAAAIAGLSWLLSQNALIQNFERQTVDYRFALRGEQSSHPAIALVLIDENTIAELGRPPYPDRYLLAMMQGLNKMGAKVIGCDFRLLHDQFEPNIDSLLLLISQCSSAVFGNDVYLNTNHHAASASHLPQLFPASNFWEIAALRNFQLYSASNWVRTFPKMPETIQSLSHTHIFTDSLYAFGQQIPLFIGQKQKLLPAFVMEILRRYYNFTASQIQASSSALTIQMLPHSTLRIPVNGKSVTHLNYLGNYRSFSQTFSFAEILKLTSQMARSKLDQAHTAVFEGKIVLLGVAQDKEIFQTPFSNYFPEIYVHATLLNNILEQKFLHSASRLINLLVLMGLAIASLLIFFTARFPRKVFWLIGLIFGFWIANFFIFTHFGMVLKLFAPSLFLTLTLALVVVFDGIQSLKNGLPPRMSIEAGSKQPIEKNSYQPTVNFTFLRIVVQISPYHDQFIVTHTLENDCDRRVGISAFHRSPQNKHPYHFPRTYLNQLNNLQENLSRVYMNYQHGKKDGKVKPIDLLKRIGQQVYNDFGLSATLNELFDHSEKNFYLNFVINDSAIPWQWAYHSMNNQLLCEAYSLGFSLAIENIPINAPNPAERPQKLLADEKVAVLLHGTSVGKSDKKLEEVKYEIDTLTEMLHQVPNAIIEDCLDLETFYRTLRQYVNENKNIRIIHYSGHIEQGQLDLGQDQVLLAGMLKTAVGMQFHSRPIVFLNGCKSGQLGHLFDKYDDLPTEFLACGASACITTLADICEAGARKFSETFYKYFVTVGASVGDALRLTQRELSVTNDRAKYDPDYDITRYFYNLYGDPTVTF